jgi:molecular chaperone DnaK (HSP70)
MSEPVFGIDLGTTNSVIAWVRDGKPECLAADGDPIVPSVVGLDPAGKLLVGIPAQRQRAAFPERTVASIKRKMGSDDKVALGEQKLTPPEVSALILKELARRAQDATGTRVRKVVITVPAFFQDAQRAATRLAGEIAGLEVVRLLNEPTAAALAFEGAEKGRERKLLVYDLGGGTFDCSIVTTDGELTEVLASHGDVLLGGDDFDLLLVEHMVRELPKTVLEEPVAKARLLQAAEACKRRLTEDVRTRVREEFLTKGAQPLHLDREVTREEFEDLIKPLLERTLDSVHQALTLAGRTLPQIDDVLLVGGQTRTPYVGRRLQMLTNKLPRRDVHPDLCVALGAAIAGARQAGVVTGRVLVDVTPYSFGPSHLGELDGEPSPDCYEPVILRGTPLPVTRAETYYTMSDDQEKVDVRIYQGESKNARDNILLGRFMVENLSPAPAGSPIVFKLTLGLDGILDVEVTEQATGMSKKVRIDGATARMTPEQVEAARKKAQALWGEEARADEDDDEDDDDDIATAPSPAALPWVAELRRLLNRARSVLARLTDEDRTELQGLIKRAEAAIDAADHDAAKPLQLEIENLVHYAEEA